MTIQQTILGAWPLTMARTQAGSYVQIMAGDPVPLGLVATDDLERLVGEGALAIYEVEVPDPDPATEDLADEDELEKLLADLDAEVADREAAQGLQEAAEQRAAQAEARAAAAEERAAAAEAALGTAATTEAAPAASADPAATGPESNRIDDIVRFVGDDAVKAEQYLEAEVAKETPRPRLVEQLEAVIERATAPAGGA